MFTIITLLESGPRIERCTPSEYDSTDQQKAAENDKGGNTDAVESSGRNDVRKWSKLTRLLIDLLEK